MEGVWQDPATAVRKFRGFIGTYGSLAQVVIRLTEETPNGGEQLRTWTVERGEEIHATGPGPMGKRR